ncbi:hypothetical protein FRC11_002899, partial [Ceratobasidium sp. 423]
PSDPDYLALLAGAKDPENHKYGLLKQYLDIADLSHLFRMTKLEAWARKQLELVLMSSHKLVRDQWDSDTLLQLRSYSHSAGVPSLQHSVKNLIQYFISFSADKDKQSLPPVRSNFSVCLDLYKYDSLKQQDPTLFGCVFAAVVSQHHRSGMWTPALTQKDKVLLYAAQVQLTSISKELQNLHWLLAPTSELPFFNQICSTCQSELPRLWTETFSKCGDLNSDTLLSDISSLSLLPQHLHSLSQSWERIRCTSLPSPNTNGSNQASNQPRRNTGWGLGWGLWLNKCFKDCTPQISDLIDKVYVELACRHAELAS